VRLYLVRHADAREKSEDPERHLSAAGRDQARRMADFLRPLGLRVGAVWHSTKIRAMETAACLAGAVTVDEGLIERDDLSPKDPVDTVARAVRKADRDVMIIGHLPQVANLASKLLAGREDAVSLCFAPAAVACLEYDAENGWRLNWMVSPNVVGGADR